LNITYYTSPGASLPAKASGRAGLVPYMEIKTSNSPLPLH